MDKFVCQKVALKYAPLKTCALYIAESLPSAWERIIYFDKVKQHDWLWIGLVRAIYGTEFGGILEERPRKAERLSRLKNDRYRLIDTKLSVYYSIRLH